MNLVFIEDVFAATPVEINTSQYFISNQSSADWGWKSFGYTLSYYGDQWETDNDVYQIVSNHDFLATQSVDYNPEIGNGEVYLSKVELVYYTGNVQDEVSSFSNGNIRSFYLDPNKPLIGNYYSYASLFGYPTGSYYIKTTSIFMKDGAFPGAQTDVMYTNYF